MQRDVSPPLKPGALRLRRLWLAGGALLVASVVLVCLLPAKQLPSLGLSDFVEHAVAYVVLMLWFAGLSEAQRWLRAAVALVLLGVAIEWLQGVMALGRIPDPVDAAANTLGVAIGLGLAHVGLGGWMRWVEKRLLRA